MEWVIQVYETPRGEKPVEVFIKRQTQKTPQKEIKTSFKRLVEIDRL